jgi:hypothetical protein
VQINNKITTSKEVKSNKADYSKKISKERREERR